VAEHLGSTLSIVEGKRKASDSSSPQPHLFLVLECSRPRLSLPARFSLAAIDEVVLGRGSARAHARVNENGTRRLVIRVPDPWMSGTHATLTKVFGRWVLEDAGSKNGTVLNGEGQKRAFLGDRDLIELGHTFFIYRDALMTPASEPADIDAAQLAPGASGLATMVPDLAELFRRLEEAATSDLPIVLTGESGTGKEILARAVHATSGRRGAFVAVNCGAIPDELIESQLFGHRKGAFSGAVDDNLGLVRAADGGTLFLDEIGDLPLTLQTAFLRVLQEREVVPVGGTRPVPVNFRLLAATHRNLNTLIARGSFREDLFARISGVNVTLPPLRERREDLGLLVATLMQRHGAPPDQSFEIDAARALFRYPWPRNIRELEKVLAGAMVWAKGTPIALKNLTDAGLDPTRELEADVEATDDAPIEERHLTDEDRQLRDELEALLREHKGNISQIARVKGKARMQIQRWCKRFRLDPESFRR
jgi:DNA-binding NtrC family response regulator